jgi:hypothetical protein
VNYTHTDLVYTENNALRPATLNAITSTTWATASNPALVQVPFTEAGTDIVVVLSAPAPSTGQFGTSGPLYPTHSLLIDDVHVQ